MRAVIVGQHKLILAAESDRIELYDLTQDPAENASRAAENDDLVSDLRDIREADLSAAVTCEAEDLELSEEELQRLRAIGYGVASAGALTSQKRTLGTSLLTRREFMDIGDMGRPTSARIPPPVTGLILVR